MKNIANYFQWLITCLSPQEWLILLLGVGIVFWAFIAVKEAYKEEKRRKQEKTRDMPG